MRDSEHQGHEWLAFTFQTQEYQMNQEEYNEIFENSEKIVMIAYNPSAKEILIFAQWND